MCVQVSGETKVNVCWVCCREQFEVVDSVIFKDIFDVFPEVKSYISMLLGSGREL